MNETITPQENTDDNSTVIVFRPQPEDETDRIGREIVRRMIEAGVIEG